MSRVGGQLATGLRRSPDRPHLFHIDAVDLTHLLDQQGHQALLGQVDGQFVDPQPYVSADGGNAVLAGQSLVAFRQWQQDLRTASNGQRSRGRSETWSQNPFSGHN